MSNNFGGNSVFSELKKVLVRKPNKDFSNADCNIWNYSSSPNLDIALQEHKQIVDILESYDVDVVYHDVPMQNKADAIYVFDPVYMSDYGAIILKPGKKLRQGEEIGMKHKLEELSIPILGELTGEAIAEGGDILWVDEKTLAIGIGFRTNTQAAQQIRSMLTPHGVDVLEYHLPYFYGPIACLHLLSFISIVDKNLAVIYPKLMPVPFYKMLVDKGFNFVEVPEDEFSTMAPNVLAIKPKICLMIEGNPITKKGLEDAGCKVHTYKGNEISLKSEGGPTCLTRPLWRG
ncbi:MAG: amidinotransferase [Bacteroidetes bacterium]|nr:amidinotransferase [Bacteroidota bacterium]